MRRTLISFDLKADFGVFKKPDVNEGLQVTFNLLHKPALLGILGAIAGLEGYQKRGEFPAYYKALRDLRISIEPLDHEKGNFAKTVIKYTNTVGYANADGNLIVTEQTLRQPAYRCFLELDLDTSIQAKLHDRILTGEAEYLPYFGKNECAAWWEKESVQNWNYSPFQPVTEFQVNSVFIREYPLKNKRVEPIPVFGSKDILFQSSFSYFERLPIDFFADDTMKFVQYSLAEFVFSDWYYKKESVMHDLFQVNSTQGDSKIIQLF